MECSVLLEKQIAEGKSCKVDSSSIHHGKSSCGIERIVNLSIIPDLRVSSAEEEEEIEILLENYLQRCESCHSQAERLLDSAKEMEDSIAVNLSSRRLKVSRVELFLQVGTFCIAVGALVAGNELSMSKLKWSLLE
ncbi:magnesium transporter MRS2-11, chloroplastic [Olea europaea subsp. europaea]|uniref:Magnesium transporter MRS2-11, chloroplastic n=1 Tax=Olea europaea subsp. europaea TaxID=158383 RepID=A0A8S0U517_OLEEU|nr:magnesium transporter MRS2-11, chloroplastic [Olea europaea subsp. europaea]